METWNAPQSLFAPLVVGTPEESSGMSGSRLLVKAALRIPFAVTDMKVRRKSRLPKRMSDEWWDRRTTVFVGEGAAPHSVSVRLADHPPPPAPVGLASTQWRVGLYALKSSSGAAAPAIPVGYTTYLLELITFRVGIQGLLGGPQLALLRHLWVAMTLAEHPGAIVLGGQRDWSDEWWSEEIAPPTADEER